MIMQTETPPCRENEGGERWGNRWHYVMEVIVMGGNHTDCTNNKYPPGLLYYGGLEAYIGMFDCCTSCARVLIMISSTRP